MRGLHEKLFRFTEDREALEGAGEATSSCLSQSKETSKLILQRDARERCCRSSPEQKSLLGSQRNQECLVIANKPGAGQSSFCIPCGTSPSHLE